MAAVLNQALQHQRAVAKSALRLAPGTEQRLGDFVGAAHQTHAAATATRHGLHQQRKAQFQRFLLQTRIVLILTQIAGCTGHAGG